MPLDLEVMISSVVMVRVVSVECKRQNPNCRATKEVLEKIKTMGTGSMLQEFGGKWQKIK